MELKNILGCPSNATELREAILTQSPAWFRPTIAKCIDEIRNDTKEAIPIVEAMPESEAVAFYKKLFATCHKQPTGPVPSDTPNIPYIKRAMLVCGLEEAGASHRLVSQAARI